ncbi:hypothetical protein SARC_01882 [Sphaeroforma arctica JP610]|uniref:Uncharacterized protein n=1 Tax=Sphaeroforma arctica JP610 TaxID=667725 RepID=A0A0L0GAB1_9EUKA|nr:hypothetical protein SARC_01882 [Sphaeroforma arctica JP610]KNC85935.1 hypothetical protein SARC_01882 [Sphaeroforma arctica JP610]|eukprot:XP_014159837.1 hypothetical protein SARC_01882 [Sphaeroforma arctica JP610]
MESVKALVEGLPDLSLLDHDGKSAVAVAKDENEEVSIFLATHLQKAKSDSEHGDSEQLSRADEHGRKQRGAMRDLAAQLLATRRQMSERDRLEEMKLDALISERDQIFGELRATKSMLEEKEWEDKQKYSVLTDEKNKMAGELAVSSSDHDEVDIFSFF